MSHFLRFHPDTLTLDIVIEKQVVRLNFEIWARGEWREKGAVR